MPYKDMRDYIAALEARGLFKWVSAQVDAQWEVSAAVRLLFRRYGQENRVALGFKAIKGHSVPLVTGIIGGSRKVYGMALECEPAVENIIEKWGRALRSPLEPKRVDWGPCKEVILKGDDADLGRFPIPIWTPEKDPAPFITAPCMITKDPETGLRNVGVYRMQVKGPRRTGVLWDLPSQHAAMNFAKYQGRPMPVTVAIGADPTVIIAAASKVPYGVDELAVAGGLRGQAIEVVKCETIDLEVPANSEIVLEGEVDPSRLEREGPFGEYTGYMGGPYEMPVFEIKCITHRRNPIYHALFSQMPPSESSIMRQMPEEAHIYKHLVHDLKIPGIIDVHLPESGSSYATLWIRMKCSYPGHSKQVLCASWTHHPSIAKWIIVADEDIDIRDPFQREWALSWRVRPKEDTFIIPDASSVLLDPSSAPQEVPLWERKGSKMCIDATKKWSYPALALPPQKYLDMAERRWEEYGI